MKVDRIRCGGETHRILISDSGSVALADHNLEHLEAWEALGGEPCRCYQILSALRGDPVEFYLPERSNSFPPNIRRYFKEALTVHVNRNRIRSLEQRSNIPTVNGKLKASALALENWAPQIRMLPWFNPEWRLKLVPWTHAFSEFNRQTRTLTIGVQYDRADPRNKTPHIVGNALIVSGCHQRDSCRPGDQSYPIVYAMRSPHRIESASLRPGPRLRWGYPIRRKDVTVIKPSR